MQGALVGDATPNKGGRPRIELDEDLLTRCLEVMCTKEETAHIMGMSPKTLERRCKELDEGGFDALLKRHSSVTKKSLRRAQIDLALKGNHTMLIFLGKQHLGQTDKGPESTF